MTTDGRFDNQHNVTLTISNLSVSLLAICDSLELLIRIKAVTKSTLVSAGDLSKG